MENKIRLILYEIHVTTYMRKTARLEWYGRLLCFPQILESNFMVWYADLNISESNILKG